MVPQLSAPLAKSIRTGEGILVAATNVALVAATALPDGPSWTRSALCITILNAVYAASRSALKFGAINKGLGIAPPPVAVLDPASIQAIVTDEQEFASVPPVTP